MQKNKRTEEKPCSCFCTPRIQILYAITKGKKHPTLPPHCKKVDPKNRLNCWTAFHREILTSTRDIDFRWKAGIDSCQTTEFKTPHWFERQEQNRYWGFAATVRILLAAFDFAYSCTFVLSACRFLLTEIDLTIICCCTARFVRNEYFSYRNRNS